MIQAKLTRKQSWVFAEAKWADLLVIAGSFRGGKTAAGVLWLVAEQLKMGHRSFALRKKYQELDDILRPEYEKWMPPQEIHKFPKNPPYDCNLRNGGVILFRHLEKGIQDLRGIEVGSILLDQGEDIPEEDFLYLFSRLSGKGARKMVVTMNPNGHDYLWKLCRKDAEVVLEPKIVTFPDEPGKEFVEEGGVYRKVIRVRFPDGSTEEVKVSLVEITAFENPHIPRDFVARELAFFDEKLVRRFVYISWEEATGLVFPDFDPEIHVIPDDFPVPDGRWSGGLDHGVSAPTAFYLWNTFWNPWKSAPFADPEDIYHVVGPEFYEPDSTVYASSISIRDLCDEFCPGQAVIPIHADPSIFAPVHEYKGKRFSDQEEYSRCGVKGRYSLRPARTRKTDIKVTSLRERMVLSEARRHLVTGRTGAPRLYIRSGCPHWIEELQTLKTKDIGAAVMRGILTEDKFEKSPTHGIDANCYNAMFNPKPGTPAIQKPKWQEDYEVELDTRSPWVA